MEQVEKTLLLTVGDISFRGKFEDKPSENTIKVITSFLREACLTVANLESPLVGTGVPPVPGKCTLRGSTKWAAVLKKCGIGLVTLANNHMMDYGEQGLFSTMAALDDVGILHVGAGKNLQAACEPLFVEFDGRKIAFLGRSAVEVSSRCYADVDLAGVAPLEEGEIFDSIRRCRACADTVVVLVHWGLEEYDYPSPSQRLLARKIIAAGADILLGHHPHVLQGEERIEGGIVSYSAGNFLFDEFPWSIHIEDGTQKQFYSSLTGKNRQGMMLEVGLKDSGKITTRRIFTRIAADATVKLDEDPARRQEYSRLCIMDPEI